MDFDDRKDRGTRGTCEDARDEDREDCEDFEDYGDDDDMGHSIICDLVKPFFDRIVKFTLGKTDLTPKHQSQIGMMAQVLTEIDQHLRKVLSDLAKFSHLIAFHRCINDEHAVFVLQGLVQGKNESVATASRHASLLHGELALLFLEYGQNNQLNQLRTRMLGVQRLIHQVANEVI
jgi:hypothetical protein